MRCLKSPAYFEETIKKSRFIGILQSAAEERQVVNVLRQLQIKHPNANHIAFAYRLKNAKAVVTRFHDAGEPSGTAGKPILLHLEGKELINTVLAVVRYFGGVKLGAGGLTRAYGLVAKKTIERADIVDYIEYDTLAFTVDYSQLRNFEYQLKKFGGEILDQDFSGKVSGVVRIPSSNRMALKRLFSQSN